MIKRHKIILEQDIDNNALSDRLKKVFRQIKSKWDPYTNFSVENINDLILSSISVAEENNYWHNLLGGSSNKSNDNDLVAESSFIHKFKHIIKEADKDDDDIMKKLNAADNGSNGEGEISLIVLNKNNFKFVKTDTNERYESKDSLKKIETFLQHNKKILADAIKNGKKQKSAEIDAAAKEGVEKGMSLIFLFKGCKEYKNQIQKNDVLDAALSFYRSNTNIWNSITKNYHFGDGIAQKKDFLYDFFVIISIIIIWFACKASKGEIKANKNSNTNANDTAQIALSSMSVQEVSDLIKRKIQKYNKNPNDKKYLEGLRNNQPDWKPENVKKYHQALDILIKNAK